MNLDENQKRQVAAWLSDGASLAEVQERLNDEFGVNATYMEVKFLVSDLDLTPRDPEPEPDEKSDAAEGPGEQPEADASELPDDLGAAEEEEALPAGDGAVSVEVDQLARPGAMISGKVTFANGKTSEWMLDQMGRLGVVPSEDGYKPTQVDLQQFQMALQDELKKMGL
jgi:hypothetical protein